MRETETEVSDDKNSELEHRNIYITTAGVTVTVKRSDNKNIQLAFINNPNNGVRKNPSKTVVYYSGDGQDPQDSGTTVVRGSYEYVPGIIKDVNGLKIESDTNGTWVELKLWG